METIINKSADDNQLNEVELANRLFDFYEPDLKFLYNELSKIFSRSSTEQIIQIINQLIKRCLDLDEKESN